MLVDKQIRNAIQNGEIKISPYDEKNIAPGAYYFHLGKYLLVPKPNQTINLVGGENPVYDKFDISTEPYVLKPNEFVLGQTLEKLTLPNNIGMLIDGRTTMARLGLTIHKTAMWVHPGHTNSIITLEIHNVGNHKIILQEGLAIGKGIFFKSSEPAEVSYKDVGIYSEQNEVMGADLAPCRK